MSDVIVHSVSDPYGPGDLIEVFCEDGSGAYEFRLVRGTRVLYQSGEMYGNPGIALRDALNLFTSDDFQVPA